MSAHFVGESRFATLLAHFVGTLCRRTSRFASGHFVTTLKRGSIRFASRFATFAAHVPLFFGPQTPNGLTELPKKEEREGQIVPTLKICFIHEIVRSEKTTVVQFESRLASTVFVSANFEWIHRVVKKVESVNRERLETCLDFRPRLLSTLFQMTFHFFFWSANFERIY